MLCREEIRCLCSSLPVGRRRTAIARLVDLGVDGFHWLRVFLLGALRALIVAAVHGGVEGADACIGVLLVRAQRAADVLDLSIVPLSRLPLTQLPGLGLDPAGHKHES